MVFTSTEKTNTKKKHIDRGNFGRLNLREVVPPFEHTLQGLFRCLQGLVAEIDRAAIMRLQDKEAYRHGRIRLLQQFVITREELVKRNEVTQRFAHLLPVDGNHVVMHPIVHRLVPLRSHRLGYLAPKYLVLMGEHSRCQPGKPSLHGEGHRMICSGEAFFQRAKSKLLCFSLCPSSSRVVLSRSSILRPDGLP